MPSFKTSQDIEKPFPDRLVSQKCPTRVVQPESGTLWSEEAGHYACYSLTDKSLPKLNCLSPVYLILIKRQVNSYEKYFQNPIPCEVGIEEKRRQSAALRPNHNRRRKS